jgi:hypothetical protein
MPPMAMVARPRADAEYSVYPADRATDRAADNSTKRTGGGIAFRRAAPHSSRNALGMNGNRGREQGRNRRNRQNFQHLYSKLHSFPVFSLQPIIERHHRWRRNERGAFAVSGKRPCTD